MKRLNGDSNPNLFLASQMAVVILTQNRRHKNSKLV